MQSLRSDIDQKMHRTKLNYYDTRTNGEILSVVTNDVDTVNNAISQNLTQIVTQVITAIGILLMMLRIDRWLAGIAIVIVPISLLAAAGVMKASGKHYSDQQNKLGQLNGFIKEMYNGQSVVQTYNYQERAGKRFDELNESLQLSARNAEIIRENQSSHRACKQYWLRGQRRDRMLICPHGKNDRRQCAGHAAIHQTVLAALYQHCRDGRQLWRCVSGGKADF